MLVCMVGFDEECQCVVMFWCLMKNVGVCLLFWCLMKNVGVDVYLVVWWCLMKNVGMCGGCVLVFDGECWCMW